MTQTRRGRLPLCRREISILNSVNSVTCRKPLQISRSSTGMVPTPARFRIGLIGASLSRCDGFRGIGHTLGADIMKCMSACGEQISSGREHRRPSMEESIWANGTAKLYFTFVVPHCEQMLERLLRASVLTRRESHSVTCVVQLSFDPWRSRASRVSSPCD